MVQVVGDDDHLESEVSLNNVIARDTSPHSFNTSVSALFKTLSRLEINRFMQSPHASQRDKKEGISRRAGTEKGKYQLWPVVKKPLLLSTHPPSILGGERTLAMSTSSPALRDSSPPTS